jgi:hypothetical protein
MNKIFCDYLPLEDVYCSRVDFRIKYGKVRRYNRKNRKAENNYPTG